MTASRIPSRPGSFTAPIIDYEPPPLGSRRRAASSGRPAPPHRAARCGLSHRVRAANVAAPRGGGVRRRGAAPRAGGHRPAPADRQLRPLMTPALIDTVAALARVRRTPQPRRCAGYGYE